MRLFGWIVLVGSCACLLPTGIASANSGAGGHGGCATCGAGGGGGDSLVAGPCATPFLGGLVPGYCASFTPGSQNVWDGYCQEKSERYATREHNHSIRHPLPTSTGHFGRTAVVWDNEPQYQFQPQPQHDDAGPIYAPTVAPRWTPTEQQAAPVESQPILTEPQPTPMEPRTLPPEPEPAPLLPDTVPLLPDTEPIEPDTVPLLPDTEPIEPDTVPLLPDTEPIEPDTVPLPPEPLDLEPMPETPAPEPLGA